MPSRATDQRFLKPVLVLALDTATEVVVAAVFRTAAGPPPEAGAQAPGDVLARAHGTAPLAHGEQVAEVVAEALAAAGTPIAAVDLIGVGRGPGPFTGLRVGLAFAESLGWSLGRPVRGVCTLDVLAAQAHVDCPQELLVATDARRREVFWARYDASGRRLEGPAVNAPADVPERQLPTAGSGARRYPEHFAHPIEPVQPDAGVLAGLVAGAAARGESPEVAPLYLRRPDAVASVSRKPVTPR